MKIKLIILIILYSGSVFSQTDENLQEKLNATKDDIYSMGQDLHKEKQKLSKVEGRVKKLEIAIGKIVEEIHVLEKANDNEEKELKIAHMHYSKTLQEVKQQQEELKQQIRKLYVLQKNSQVKILLDTKDYNNSRLLGYYAHINKNYKRQISQQIYLLEDLSAMQGKLQEQTALHKENKRKMQNKKIKLLNQQKQHEKVLVEVQDSINLKNKKLSILKKDEKTLAEKLQKLTRISKGKKSILHDLLPHYPIKANKLLIEKNVNLTSLFIYSKVGSPVYAVHDGRVVFADWLRGYGLMLIIDHGNGLLSLYGHNQSILKHVGDKIRQGEIISLVGQSGSMDKPGLYFEIRENTKPIHLGSLFKYEFK